LLLCTFQRLVDSITVSDHLVHPGLKLVVAALYDLEAFPIDRVQQTFKVAFEQMGSLVPPFLDDNSAVLSPSLQNFELVNILPAFQFGKCQLFLHTLQPFAQRFEHMRTMLFAGCARNAEKRVVAGEADH